MKTKAKKAGKKAFDCVAMKRRGSLRLYRTLSGMTLGEKAEFWRRQDASLLREQKRIRLLAPGTSPARK